MFNLTIVNKILRHWHSWLARQYFVVCVYISSTVYIIVLEMLATKPSGSNYGIRSVTLMRYENKIFVILTQTGTKLKILGIEYQSCHFSSLRALTSMQGGS